MNSLSNDSRNEELLAKSNSCEASRKGKGSLVKCPLYNRYSWNGRCLNIFMFTRFKIERHIEYNI